MQSTRTKQYPQELRESVARRYLSTDASYRELAAEIGGSTWSIRDWVRQYREQGLVGKNKNKSIRSVSVDKRGGDEKLRLVLEAKSLSDEARGEFLRREGLHDGDLERWEQEALEVLRAGQGSKSQGQRIRELELQSEKQLKRLKEATALLELQKKVQALWGDEDSDTNQS